MPSTITVGSKAHASIRITEPMPEKFKDKPGEAPALRSVVLAGANDPAAKAGMGITAGVESEVFHAWLDAEKNANTALANLVFEMSEEEAKDTAPPPSGFQPALDALKADPEEAAKAAQGSAVTVPGPVKASDMAASSNTPNDDTPRGDPSVTGEAQTQTPATAKVAPAAAQPTPPATPAAAPLLAAAANA